MHDDDDDVDDLEFIEDSSDAEAEALSDDNADGPGVATYVVRVGIALALIAGVIGIAVAVFPNVKKQLGIDDEGAVIDFKPGDPLPDPPLQLTEPPAPASRVGEIDLLEVDPHSLQAGAGHFVAKGDLQSAIQCQHFSVIRSDAGRYNLACYYSRAGNVEAALYWLQVGAREEGADAVLANRDSDFVNLRKDPRWPKLLPYLRVYQRYWETSGISEVSLVLPHDSTPEEPVPLFIGLHGVGANASGFVDPASYQTVADEMGVAFLAVSGTNCRGKQSFAWSEDLDKDLARIGAALQETADRLTPAKGKTVLFGFSQGGWLSGQLALRHPDRFAGAIVLSPGSLTGIQFGSPAATPDRRRQGTIAVCGAREHPATVACTKECAAAFERLGVRVYQKHYPDMNTHTFPPDYWEKLPIWGRFILDPEAPVPTP